MKKIGAFVISLLMIIGCFSVTVFAVDDTTQTEKKKVYSVLVVDVSGEAKFYAYNLWSKYLAYTADSAIDYVKEASKTFLTNLINSGNENYVAVVSYAGDTEVVSGFSNNVANIIEKVDNLSINHTEDGEYERRNINAGLLSAKELLDNVDDDDITKNIILVTTGHTDTGEYSEG